MINHNSTLHHNFAVFSKQNESVNILISLLTILHLLAIYPTHQLGLNIGMTTNASLSGG